MCSQLLSNQLETVCVNIIHWSLIVRLRSVNSGEYDQRDFYNDLHPCSSVAWRGWWGWWGRRGNTLETRYSHLTNHLIHDHTISSTPPSRHATTQFTTYTSVDSPTAHSLQNLLCIYSALVACKVNHQSLPSKLFNILVQCLRCTLQNYFTFNINFRH